MVTVSVANPDAGMAVGTQAISGVLVPVGNGMLMRTIAAKAIGRVTGGSQCSVDVNPDSFHPKAAEIVWIPG